MMGNKEFILEILENAKGDDLERATRAFRDYTDRDLDTQYGLSGMTCRQILESYQRQRNKIGTAIKWLKSA